MTPEPAAVLLAQPDRIDRLAAQLRQAGVEPSVRTDPEAAIEELAGGSVPAVIVSIQAQDSTRRLETIRSLQPEARVIAICDPCQEPEMRDLLGLAIDEYFIYPAGDREIGSIAAMIGERRAAPAPQRAALGAGDVCELIEAATSLPALEAYLAGKIGPMVQAEVAWVADAPGESDCLLHIAGRSERRLVAREEATVSAEASAYLEAIGEVMPALVSTAHRTETLHRLAITDHLTGAYNRRYFYHASDRILREAQGSEARVTLLLFDLDDFKQYNDTYGHATGDLILQEVTQLMQSITRSQDIVARIGGDEFAVLFWDEKPPRKEGSTPPAEAHELARRFCQAMKTHDFTSLGPQGVGKLTISGGLASFPVHGRSCQELLRQADVALHEVKRTGKNAICLVGRVGEYVSDAAETEASPRRRDGAGPGQFGSL
jgi:diguanylate cyclase (GGDEF)-like protein